MEEVRHKGLDECVSYRGSKQLEDLVSAIEECDVGVIPNQRNPFTDINTPTRIFEYLALGKPVVAPRTPGILDYFDGESLFLFEAGNCEELADKIVYAFLHSPQTLEKARRGQEVYRRHAWHREKTILVNVLNGLLQ